MDISEGSVISGRWVLRSKIDTSCTGSVYSATDRNNRGSFLVKLERRSSENTSLRREFTSYKQIGAFGKKVTGFPSVHFYGQHGSHNALVLDGVTTSLSSVIDVHAQISHQMTMSVGIQALNCLEFLHNKGVIHGNLNPNIIRFMNEEMYLVNLEHSTSVRSRCAAEYACFKTGNRKPGDVMFASESCHAGFSLSRKDDLESLGYVLVYTYNRSLPWNQFDSTSEGNKIHELKHCISTSELCERMTEEMKSYFKTVRCLEYSDTPDYAFLRELLRKALLRKTGMESDRFNTDCLPLHRARLEKTRKDAEYQIKKDTPDDKGCGDQPVLTSGPGQEDEPGEGKNLFANWTTLSSSSSSKNSDNQSLPDDYPVEGSEVKILHENEQLPDQEHTQPALGNSSTGTESSNQQGKPLASNPHFIYGTENAMRPQPHAPFSNQIYPVGGLPPIPQTHENIFGYGAAVPWHRLSDQQRVSLAARQLETNQGLPGSTNQGRVNSPVGRPFTPYDEATVRWAEREYDQLMVQRKRYHEEDNVSK